MKDKKADIEMQLYRVKDKIKDIQSRRDKLHDFNEFVRGRHYESRKKAIAAFDSILSELADEERFLNERI